MPTTHTWKIRSAKVHDRDGKSDIIHTVLYDHTVSDGAEQAVNRSRVSIPYDPDGGIIDIADITEEQLIGWVKEALVANARKDIEKIERQQRREDEEVPASQPITIADIEANQETVVNAKKARKAAKNKLKGKAKKPSFAVSN